jgi:hypothetical protein
MENDLNKNEPCKRCYNRKKKLKGKRGEKERKNKKNNG